MSIGSFSQYINKLIIISRFLKGNTSIRELDELPARYLHAIFKQYHLFSKNQEAQQAAAAEDMVEELEDGAAVGAVPSSSNNERPMSKPMMSAREEQLKKIREIMANANSTDPEDIYVSQYLKKEEEIKAAREAEKNRNKNNYQED